MQPSSSLTPDMAMVEVWVVSGRTLVGVGEAGGTVWVSLCGMGECGGHYRTHRT